MARKAKPRTRRVAKTARRGRVSVVEAMRTLKARVAKLERGYKELEEQLDPEELEDDEDVDADDDAEDDADEDADEDDDF